MSEPKLTADSLPLTREDAINLIISSIAMEEMGLSHIINAEGEKLQYALGTLEGAAKPAAPLTVDDLLALNKSIHGTLDSTMKNQMLLSSKLQSALNTPTMQGPPGPTGAVGTILGSYDTFDELKKAHPTGNQGDAYLVDGVLYVWNTETNLWKNVGDLTGPAGPEGLRGATGAEGKSAYEIAVEKGFKGTEVEWLNSLKASSVTIIPFASQQAPYVGANSGGKPVNVALLGFGYLGFSTGMGGENAHIAIPIDPDGSFNLGASGNSNRQIAFSMPFDMKLNSIYMTTGNWEAFSILIPPGTEVFPYVQIYTAPAGTNAFLPIKEAIAKPTEGLHPERAQASTMLNAEISGLEIELKAGTRIAICGMMEIIGDTAPRNYYLYFTGGIGLSNWVKS